MTHISISELKPMTEGIVPITTEERLARIEKAQRLMAQHQMEAVYIEAGLGLSYFAGVDWWRSERMLAAILPARGELVYICPGFEEVRLRELITVGSEVRIWEEHESPYDLVARTLRDHGVSGRVGIEESTRFFLFDGIRRAAPRLEFVSADPVTIACRAYKSPAELALMQRAADISIAAYKVSVSLLREGMSQAEFAANAAAAHRALGVQIGGIGAEFGKSSAFPHGSRQMEFLKEGDVVLMDGGCTLEGYHSDISRAVVFGKPTQRMRDVWEVEQAAQAAAFAAAQVGAPCEVVDAAARQVITAAGFGPGYQVPGLPHRTGHGIGLDVHEWYNMVQGEQTPLAPGMCFSDEPMICIYGEFGIRLEDCIYMTTDGPRFFTQPSPSIDQPFA